MYIPYVYNGRESLRNAVGKKKSAQNQLARRVDKAHRFAKPCDPTNDPCATSDSESILSSLSLFSLSLSPLPSSQCLFLSANPAELASIVSLNHSPMMSWQFDW